MRTSSAVNAVVNLIGVVVGLCLVFVEAKGYSGCELLHPIGVYIFLLVLSFVGFILAMLQIKILKKLFSWLLSLLLVFCLVLTGISFLGARKSFGARTFTDHEISLDSYRSWFQESAFKAKGWNNFKSCVVDKKICEPGYHADDREFMIRHPVEYGCCRPPYHCGYIFNNKTNAWEPPKPDTVPKNHDCTTWDDNNQKLCLDCNTCKAGFMVLLEHTLNGSNLLLFMYSIILLGCFAFDADHSKDNQYYR